MERHGIVHWLDYGALLGAVRDNALVPWDEDVDFGCLGEDFDLLKSLGPEIERAGFYLDLSDPLVVRITYSATNFQHLDVFPWFEHDGLLTMRFHSGFDWPGMSERGAFPARYIENLETVRLYHEEFPAPSPVDTFLKEHRFGEDYMVPQRSLFHLRLPEMSFDEATPTVRELIDRLGAVERQFLTLKGKPTRGRYSRAQRWVDAGVRPIGPDPQRVRVLREALPNVEPSPLVDTLVDSIAVLEQAVQELEHPDWRVAVRRGWRRARRLLRSVPRGGPSTPGRH